MILFAPKMLWLLAILPILTLAYVLLMRRRNKNALRYANLGLLKSAIGRGQRIRRHVPPALFLLALGIAIFSISRPAAVVTLPSQHGTIILAMDVSGSMKATDVAPQRISAAQTAAIDFVKDQPASARIGVVAFSSNAMTVQRPTENREEIVAAISRLTPQRYTAMGSGILTSLANIFGNEDFENDMSRGSSYSLDEAPPPEPKEFKPVMAGSFASAVIILLTDGQTNMGTDPVAAAKAAAQHGVRVFTVGFGSEQGGLVEFEGHTTRVRLDEPTLKRVADITRGAYYRAGNLEELHKVYKTLSTTLVMEAKETELTGVFAGAAAFFVVMAAALSMLWVHRIA